jgi:triacylglycerol lipase
MEEIVIEKAEGVSKVTIALILAATIAAAISVVSHTHAHLLSKITLGIAIFFGSLALIKLLSAVAALFPRPVRSFIYWIHAVVFEILTFFCILPWLHLTRFCKKYDLPIGSHSGKPILLIHGYCNDGTVWLYIRKKLAESGLGPIYLIHMGHPFRSVQQYADLVQKRCHEIRKETGHEELILIGHSMGGLVATICALQCDLVSEVITIASPLAGTRVARIGLGQNARDMRIKSSIIVSAAEKLASEKRVKFSHMGTKTDQLIIPSSSSLPGINPSREFQFEDIGHASLLFSPRVAALLVKWIQS